MRSLLACLWLLLTALPAQVVHAGNLGASPYDGWVRATIDVMPEHKAGLTAGGVTWVLGREVGRGARTIDLQLHLEAGDLRSIDLAKSRAIEFRRPPPPAPDEAGVPRVAGREMALVAIREDGAGYLVHLRARTGRLLCTDLWLVWYPGQAWARGEVVCTASNPAVPDVVETIPVGGLKLSWPNGLVLLQGAPDGGSGLLLASGETIADGQARSYALTVVWPERLGNPGPAGVSGWSSAGVAAVGGIAANGISRLYPARKVGKPRPRAGAVAFEQRFDSALRLNVHFHVVWLDGVYAWDPGCKVEWCPHDVVGDADVGRLVKAIRDRVVRCLRRMGRWHDESVGGVAADADDEQQLLLELGSAAVQGRASSGERDVRAGRGTRDEPFVKGPLCADADGFSLHAGVVVSGPDRERLEKLLRYAGRPAIAESRLSLLPDGRVAYSLKKRWKDGSTAVVMSPQVFLERLIALVPRPRRHLVTYHGVLAPAAGLRSRIVPQVEEGEGVGCGHAGEGDEEVAVHAVEVEATCRVVPRRVVPHAPGPPRRGRRRYSWAQLLARVFLIDVLRCPCGGIRTVLAAIHDPVAIRKVLGALGLPSEVPVVAAARSPPEQGAWCGA